MVETIKLPIYLQISSVLDCFVVLFKAEIKWSVSLINSLGKTSKCFLHSYRYTSRKTDKLKFTISGALRFGLFNWTRLFRFGPDIFGSSHKAINVKGQNVLIVFILTKRFLAVFNWTENYFIILGEINFTIFVWIFRFSEIG